MREEFSHFSVWEMLLVQDLITAEILIYEDFLLEADNYHHAIAIADEMNSRYPDKAFYVEQIDSHDNTHQLYGSTFKLLNSRPYKTKISYSKES